VLELPTKCISVPNSNFATQNLAMKFATKSLYLECIYTVNPDDAGDFTECYDHEVESSRIRIKQCHDVDSCLRINT